MFKICTKCKLEKEHFNSKISWCKECRKSYSKIRNAQITQRVDFEKFCTKCKFLSKHSPKGLWCKKCTQEYGINYSKANKDLISNKMKLKRKQCPEYARKHLYKKKYNITIEDYNQLLENQNNSCAICKSVFSGRGNNLFDVDHCHSTGKVRGLLCIKCNFGLGSFKDDIKALFEAINYLNKNKECVQ